MIIKDPVTCESLVRDNYPRMPNDGYGHFAGLGKKHST